MPAHNPDSLHASRGVLAGHINAKYAGRMIIPLVSKQRLSDWMMMQRLPDDCAECFPLTKSDGTWSKKAIYAWVEKYLLQKEGQEVLPLTKDPKEEIQQLKAEDLRMDLEDKRRARDRRWMLREEHEAALRGCGEILWPRLDDLIERELIDGLQAEADKGLISQDAVDRARKRHQDGNDAFKRECAGEGIDPDQDDRKKETVEIITEPEAVS